MVIKKLCSIRFDLFGAYLSEKGSLHLGISQKPCQKHANLPRNFGATWNPHPSWMIHNLQLFPRAKHSIPGSWQLPPRSQQQRENTGIVKRRNNLPRSLGCSVASHVEAKCVPVDPYNWPFVVPSGNLELRKTMKNGDFPVRKLCDLTILAIHPFLGGSTRYFTIAQG